MELEVLDRLRTHEHTVRLLREFRDQRSRGAAREVCVLEFRCIDDGRGTHAVQVLEIRTDVREPVLQGLDRRHPRKGAEALGAGRSDGAPGGFGHGDVGAVGQSGVDLGLRAIGAVEDRGGCGERRRQRDQCE